MMYLAVDNTRPIDPTVPDLYEGAANDDGNMPAGVAIAIALGGFLGRFGSVGFWIAVGVVAGLVI